MRLASVTLARDEADIIELFVRHTLHFVDRMYIVDDGSTDDTSLILSLLEREGLPLVVIREGNTAAYQQGLRTTALMQRAMRDENWHFVLPLDADEFITAVDREDLHGDLAALPKGAIGAFSLRQYLPPVSIQARGASSNQSALSRISCVLDLPRHPNKIVVPGSLAAHRETLISDGNHRVSRYHTELPAILLAHCDLAHIPVRSMDQLAAKCLVSYVRWRARSDYMPATAAHHMAGVQVLADEPGLLLTKPELLLLAYLPEAGKPVRHDPPRILGECRYPHLARIYPYRRLLGSLDALVEHSRSDAREMAAMRKKLARRGPVLARFSAFGRKLHRSVMKRCLAVRMR